MTPSNVFGRLAQNPPQRTEKVIGNDGTGWWWWCHACVASLPDIGAHAGGHRHRKSLRQCNEVDPNITWPTSGSRWSKDGSKVYLANQDSDIEQSDIKFVADVSSGSRGVPVGTEVLAIEDGLSEPPRMPV